MPYFSRRPAHGSDRADERDDLVHTGTDNSGRTKPGSDWFHHTAPGLASTTTNGVDTGFIREPAGI
ncbi:hypothetical protein [Streptomyces sp. NPDC003015]